jgi:hypothetical protein
MIINYCKEGISVSDFEDIEGLIIRGHLRNETINVSNQSVVDMARVLFVEGKITDLKIQFNGENIGITEDGMFEKWPKGFCDLCEKLAQRLLRWQADRYRKSLFN